MQGRTVLFTGADILDRTPLLDIKPYLPAIEAFPDARQGWLGELGEESYEVVWDPGTLANAQATEEQHAVDLVAHSERILSQDPLPHPYKRIRRNSDGSYTLAMKYWRLDYTVDNDVVMISRLRSELPDAVSV